MADDVTTDDLGFNRSLTRGQLFGLLDDLGVPPALQNSFTKLVKPGIIGSGGLIGQFSMSAGYMESGNYVPGVNGWKFDHVGNLEANTGTFRGSLYATTGNIGGWIIDSQGLYYNGVGTPNIRTASTVGSGTNGVILDKDGIRGYHSTLGVVFNLKTDGSTPIFSSGTIEQTTFEINTNAVLRTSSTVGDGSASSAGVLVNNTGLYGCGASQSLEDANIKILATGDAYFKGTINASTILSSELYSATLTSPIITGGIFQTATTGQRIEITSEGITLLTDGSSAAYNDATYKYNNATRTYGTGVLAYINNTEVQVPLYFNAEQAVGDIHFYDRSGDPSGAAEIGDVCVVSGEMKICTAAGTPGTWVVVGTQT